MLDLTRYKGLLTVAAGLLCAFVLLNAALLAAFGREPAMFDDPDRQLAWSQLERMGAQVAGVEQQMRRNGKDDQPAFGVILGQSTTLRGINPAILEKNAEPHRPWLLLNGFGSSFVKLHYYAQTLLASDLRPGAIMLGLHETMLAGQDREDAEPAAPVDVDEANDKKVTGWRLRRAIMHPIWVRTQRADISHHVNMALFEARLAMHKTLGSGAVSLFTPAERPWRASSRDDLPPRRPNAFLRRQVNGWRDFGWYDPASYDTANRHADAFRKLIDGCDALGPKRIVIVLMPVTSDLRSWLPPEAMQAMRRLIDEVSGGRPIVVLDLRDAMPDDAFADYAHLNPGGREVFSGILAERLNELNTR